MKKTTAGAAAAFLAVCLLAGCGGDGGNPAVTNRDLKEMKVESYVKLGDYSNLNVTVAPAEVDPGQWDELTLAVYQSYVSEENGGITDRAVEMGDTVNMDYEGRKDGAAFEGGTASGASLTIGSGEFIDGFEDGLVGVMPGETLDLDLTFPENYRNEELAGQPVVFTVTVNYILPGADEMEDSVVAAMELPEAGTVEELRQYVYDYLMVSAEDTYLYDLQDAIMEALVNASEIEELPETFVDSYKHVYSENLASIAGQNGLDAETYTNYAYGMSSADFVNLYSQVQARQELVLQAIANKEGLTVDDEELQQKLEEFTANAGAASVEEMLGNYDREEYRNYIMSDKVMEFLMDRVTVTEAQTE